MPHFEKFTAEMAYNSGDGFFWATKVDRHDTINVIFDKEQKYLTRIVVVTGNDQNPHDTLQSGSLLVGPNVTSVDVKTGAAVCENMQQVATFSDGRAAVENLQNVVQFPVRCIQIRVDASQRQWVVFRRIAVFLKETVDSSPTPYTIATPHRQV